MNVVNQIKELLGMDIKLAQMKLMDGVTVFEADTFEMGDYTETKPSVFILNGEEKVPVPVGEYILEDGHTLKVEVEGIIAAIVMPEEVAEDVTEEEALMPETEMATEVATPKRVVESVTKEMFFSEIEKLRAEIAELKLSKTEVVKAVELSNDNIEVLSHNPDAKTEVKMNLFSKKRQTTTFDVVLSKLNK